MAVRLTVNGDVRSLDVEGDTPLLWVIRDELGLKGTKFGCGAGLCGACTVHFNGAAVRSCQLPVQAASGAELTTIEGLSESDPILQTLWVELNVPQCGYCQAGVLMAAADLLKRIPKPTDADIDAQISNICRCGTYPRIRAAIHRAAGEINA